MFRIDSSGNQSNKFTQGNPLATPPIPPTVISDEWLNAIQEEISHVIEASGGSLNKADSTQLWQAIVNYINNQGTNLPNANALMRRDANGRVQAADPIVSQDVVNLEFLNNNGTALPDVGALMRRDANGRAQVSDPVTAQDIVPKHITDAISSILSNNGVGLTTRVTVTDCNNIQGSGLFRIDSAVNTPINYTTNYIIQFQDNLSNRFQLCFSPSGIISSVWTRFFDITWTQWINIAAPPVGGVYVQYTNQSSPASLFGGTWLDITSSYTGYTYKIWKRLAS